MGVQAKAVLLFGAVLQPRGKGHWGNPEWGEEEEAVELYSSEYIRQQVVFAQGSYQRLVDGPSNTDPTILPIRKMGKGYEDLIPGWKQEIAKFLARVGHPDVEPEWILITDVD